MNTSAPRSRRRGSQSDQRLRFAFRSFNRFMLMLWHLGLGPMLNSWPAVGGRIMVIAHMGRVSGKRRETPVNFAPDGEAVLCLSGFGRRSDWYQNLMADPRVEVRLPRARWSGVAEDISRSVERASLVRRVLIASGFAAYLAGINPRRVSDPELERLTEDYRLVRIRPV